MQQGDEERLSWSSNHLLVMSEIKRLSNEQKETNKIISDFVINFTTEMAVTKTKMESKSGLYGAMMGSVAAVLVEIIRAVLTK